MPFLDQETADAVCTLILIGYLNDPTAKSNVQYAPEDEVADYTTVSDSLKKVGISTKFTCSVPQDKFPFIVALSPKFPTLQSVVDQFNSNGLVTYLKKINDAANATPTKDGPYGAYIGGGLSVSGINLFGPSQLDWGKVIYRDKNDDQNLSGIDNFYDNAAIAVKALLNTPTAGVSQKLNLTKANCTIPVKKSKPVDPPITFIKSYHGMIQAICSLPDFGNEIIFEIALGNQTKKVSSCLPCSLFMAANGTPASSTHLGRGDYWNIPDTGISGPLRKAWTDKVNSWFKAGVNKAGKLNTKFSKASSFNNGSDIANVFLEALTFPSSFTKKINSTFL